MNQVQENIRLAELTTLGVGGPARYFVEVTTPEGVLEAMDFARRRSVALVPIGGGSNVLVSDTGYDGLVLRVAIRGISIVENGPLAQVVVGAGEEWDPLVSECVRRDLSGIECLSGIPGWVGGTPIQNVGAYGQEVSQVISSVRVYDRSESRIVDLNAEACGFAYRSSTFNTAQHGRYIVLQVSYELRRDGASTIAYPDLQHVFRDRSEPPSLEEVRAAVLAIRASKAMLLVEGEPDSRSAGSFFKNPILSRTALAHIESVAGDCRIPSTPLEEDRIKVPAAWLIERAGFRKGWTRGAVGISRRHPLALINRGGATAGDLLALAGEIRDRVRSRFGVNLEPEPVFVGFPDALLKHWGARSPN